MASAYTPLGVQLMVTGEKAGLWGGYTNTNLEILEQIAGGYTTQAVADGTTTALTVSDGSTGATIATSTIKMTGALTGASGLSVPDDITGMKYLVINATTGGQTVTFKTAGGTGVGWSTTDAKLLYHDGTNIVDSGFGISTSPGGSDTQIQYNNSSAFGGAAGLTTDGTHLSILAAGSLKLSDTDNSDVLAMKADGTTTGYTITWPPGVATVSGQALKSTTGGVLSWGTAGTAWQAVVTGTSQAAVAGNGYFIDTTANVCNVTLPAGALGDEVSIVDYAGTFDTYNLTVTPASGEKIQGQSADTTMTSAVERSAFTLVYSGATQGWLLKDK